MALDDDVEKSDDYKKIKEEVEKLKLDENKFREERVCMPNPKVIFDKACSLANKLSDDNDRFRLLHSLDKSQNRQNYIGTIKNRIIILLAHINYKEKQNKQNILTVIHYYK